MAYPARPGTVQIAVITLAALLFAAPSHAYLDPGTGSIILQSILAGVAVAIGFLRMYWQRFKAFLSSLTGKADIRDEQEIAPESDTGNST